jgi:hypothetical protein
MNWKNWLVSIASAGLLAACGGGGSDAGTSPFDPDSGGGSSTAASLLIELDKTSVANTDTAGVTATVTAVDSQGKTLPDIAITYTVTGGIYTQATNVTDENGDNEAVVKLGANKANRTITIRATDGNKTATAYLTVTGAKLNSTASPAVVAPSASGSVIFRLQDAASDAMANQNVEIVTSTGAAATGVTNSSGEYAYTFTAPSTTGTMTVTATAAGVTTTQDVLIQSSSSSIPDAGVIAEKSMDINPTVVSVNTAGSTSNAAIVRVLFRGSSNNALPNVRVKFDLADDPNSVGGTFSVNNVYTDANGYATTSYIPGTKPSPTNGVIIRACYATTGAPADVVCGGSNVVSSTLTVTSEAVSVSIGSDENVYTDQALVYYRRFVVQVVDAAGRAMPGVTITPQVDLLNYAKGFFFGEDYASRLDYQCVNEDLNRNATLDSSEDLNHDLALSPRKADVAVSVETVGTDGKTDANGRIILRVTYPRSTASWVKYALNVAGSVDGSEGRASWIEWAPYPATALSGSGAPAFVTSPYGVVTENVTLTAGTVLPDGTSFGTDQTLTPCQNPTPPNEILP